MSIWCNRNWLLRTNHHLSRRQTPKAKLPWNGQLSEVEKSNTTLFRFLNFYQNFVPRLSQRLAPFYKMLKSHKEILLSKDLVQQFEEINKALDKCCDVALQHPLPNKQIALMTDASFAAARYAFLREYDPNQKLTSLRKSYAPVAYGSKHSRQPR